MSDSKAKDVMITELQNHVKNLSGSILSIVEFWENETAEIILPSALTDFDKRMKFYREIFAKAQKVAQPSTKR